MSGDRVNGYFYQRVDSANMKIKVMAAAFIILMIASCMMPTAAAEDSGESGGSDDSGTNLFNIVVPFHPLHSTIPKILENGQSTTYTVYLTNLSEHILHFEFVGEVNASYLSYTLPEPQTLMPAGNLEGKDFQKVEFTVYVAEVTGSHTGGEAFLYVKIANLDDENYIDMVPITFGITVESNFDTSGSYNRFFGIINNTLTEPFNTPYVPFIVTLIGFLLLAFVAVKILIPLITKNVEENKERTKKILSLAVTILAIVLFIDPGLRILGADLGLILQVQRISFTILTVVLAVAIWKIYMILVESMLSRVGRNENSPIDISFLPIFSMLGKFVLWVGGAAAILHIYGFDLTGILISAGIITLGITLGAQSVLSQLFNGISILLTRPFSEGDCLQINGEVYIVKRVKLMHTEFTSVDYDRAITIPNDVVASATIINMSKYDRAYYLHILFQIPYGEDVKKVEKILLEMAEEDKHVLHDYDKYKKPAVKLIDFKDSGILMKLEVMVMDFSNTTTVSDMKKALYKKLTDEGITIPFNRLDVTILEEGSERSSYA